MRPREQRFVAVGSPQPSNHKTAVFERCTSFLPFGSRTRVRQCRCERCTCSSSPTQGTDTATREDANKAKLRRLLCDELTPRMFERRIQPDIMIVPTGDTPRKRRVITCRTEKVHYGECVSAHGECNRQTLRQAIISVDRKQGGAHTVQNWE